MIRFTNSEEIQLWVYDYHIHHTFLSLCLLIIGLLIWYAGRKKKKSELQCIGVFIAAVAAVAFVQWVVAHYVECGGLLWITRGV